ncbi:hypothetical protein VTK56DRAFT_8294 [Thermocarpiscus australiensis]
MSLSKIFTGLTALALPIGLFAAPAPEPHAAAPPAPPGGAGGTGGWQAPGTGWQAPTWGSDEERSQRLAPPSGQDHQDLQGAKPPDLGNINRPKIGIDLPPVLGGDKSSGDKVEGRGLPPPKFIYKDITLYDKEGCVESGKQVFKEPRRDIKVEKKHRSLFVEGPVQVFSDSLDHGDHHECTGAPLGFFYKGQGCIQLDKKKNRFQSHIGCLRPYPVVRFRDSGDGKGKDNDGSNQKQWVMFEW